MTEQPLDEPEVKQSAEPAEQPTDIALPADPRKPASVPAQEAEQSATTDPPLAQLNVRLPKVAFDKVPLRQFVAFAAEASKAEIVIDYRSLRAAGFKSPTVTVRATDRPLGELLKETLDKIGLAFEPRGPAIFIFAPQRTADE